MKPKKQNPLHNLRIARERASQIKQGFFDGRFVERKEPSKKNYSRVRKHRNEDNELPLFCVIAWSMTDSKQ